MGKSYVYVLRCCDGSLYTGWTNDLSKRLRAHNGEERGGAKYTRSRRPVALVYSEEYESAGEAMQRECAIKRLSRRQKEALFAGTEMHAALSESKSPSHLPENIEKDQA